MDHDHDLSLTRRDLLAASAALALGSASGDAASGAEPAAMSVAREASDPGTAVWQSFCDALRPLAMHVGPSVSGDDPLTQLEGIRCLSRLLALGLDRFLEFADPGHPAFYELQTPTRKYLGDNPDQTYRVAAIDGSGEYRVRGTLEGAVGVEIGVYAGDFRSDDKTPGGGRRLVASRDERTLEANADGEFTLHLGPTAGPGNHLQTAPDTSSLLIRTYFLDRALRLRHAMPTIERLDVSTPPPPLDLAILTRGLLGTAAFIDGSLAFWNQFEGTHTKPNELIAMPDDGSVQTPSLVRYINGRVELDPENAMVIEFTPKDEPGYWSWVLQNPWGETPDWREHSVVLNKRDVTRGRDGRITVVIAQRRPQKPDTNWLDLAGHRRTLVSLRWRGDSPLPSVETRVVPVASLT